MYEYSDFTILKLRTCRQDDGSFGCPVANEEEEGACDMPACDWTEWGVWSECGGADCGETGSMSRTRDCVPPVSSSQPETWMINRAKDRMLTF